MDPTTVVAAAAVAMIAIEAAAPGRRFPKVPGWLHRSLPLNAFQVALVAIAGLTWDRWTQGWSLFTIREWNTGVAAVTGYTVITFVYYWWHRARHAMPVLWRWLHQVHHSPARVEVLTTFYKHPLESIFNSVLNAAILYVILGLNPTQGALTLTIAGLAELLYHWNVRTPWWLGFVFQRPEMHHVHHARGYHHCNYSDLPLWDMLFGTFHNPRQADLTCGFRETEELRLADMLWGTDVIAGRHEPREGQSLSRPSVPARSPSAARRNRSWTPRVGGNSFPAP